MTVPLVLADFVTVPTSGEVATAQTDPNAGPSNVTTCLDKMNLASNAKIAAAAAASTASLKKGNASDAADDAHVAQNARNHDDANTAAALALTASNDANTASDNAKTQYESAWDEYILAARAAGVACKARDGTEYKTDGAVYIDPDGKRVPSYLEVRDGNASAVAALRYSNALIALDSLSIAIANYNSDLAVPSSDPDKKTVDQMNGLLTAINLLRDDYDTANLLALASAANAKDCATHTADALAFANAAKMSSDAAKADAAAALAYKLSADNDVTNSSSRPVTLNFNVEVDADSSLSVFGDKPLAPDNVIVASYKLAVESLYDSNAGEGLIEFWEPKDAQGDIRVELAHNDDFGEDSYRKSAVKLVNGLEAILCDSFDCSGCKPFNDSRYASESNYYKQRDFGRVALGTLAHYVFGHVDATSAITNDVSFIKSMLSLDQSGADDAAVNEDASGAAARLASYVKMSESKDLPDVDALYTVVGSAADAKLAKRLVGAILRKGMYKEGLVVKYKSSNVIANKDDQSCLANIVRQVIGQDQTRAMNEDNSERTVEQHVLLRFYPGDTVYMNIKLKKPTISLSPGPSALTPASLADSYSSEISFTLKMELV